jgi:uncharacterized membrane protein
MTTVTYSVRKELHGATKRSMKPHIVIAGATLVRALQPRLRPRRGVLLLRTHEGERVAHRQRQRLHAVRGGVQTALISPELGAHLAAYAEHLFPLLLALGLATRLSALGQLAMTAVIQFFVYPAAWPTHLTWAVGLLYLAGRGGGALSLDRLLGIR